HLHPNSPPESAPPTPVTLATETKMPSELKSETARANGAKSRGPVTPEGKAISSRNSVRHGLRATAIVLPGESRAEFQALLDSYVHQFKPAGDVERDLVQTLAITRWRLNRLTGVESHMFSTEMVLRRKDAD